MLVLLDNYDSFTYNIYQLLGDIGIKAKVIRNDEVSINELEKLNPSHIIISPGPCTPLKAGISLDVIDKFKGKTSILGICLGHQAIGHYFGGNIVKAEEVVHGKTSSIFHDKKGVFHEISAPFTAIRYHSLIIDSESIPDCLEITAKTELGVIMGVRHKKYSIEGVQFHPESILTEYGRKILNNFINID